MQTLKNILNINDLAKQSCFIGFVRNKYMIPKRSRLTVLALMASLILTTDALRAEQATSIMLAASSDLENTQRNIRDSSGATLTPQNQKATRGDRKITAAIRRAVVNNKDISMNAHNAKIITRDGVVTLRGPVENNNEKSILHLIAEKTRGVKHVNNQLEPKTP